MRIQAMAAVLALAIPFSVRAAEPAAAPAKTDKAAPAPAKSDKGPATAPAGNGLAPNKDKVVSSHGPYESGDCSLCHANKDPRNPGAATKPVNGVCFACHEDMQDVMTKSKFKHKVADAACTNCHNPHNSTQPKLLRAAAPGLCLNCHAKVEQAMKSEVKHQALQTGAGCANCHSPHASNVEHLLLRLPFDQCISCHDKDNVADATGKPLTNYKKLLQENPVHHAPVAAKDCSSCHQPHGSAYFRLLVSPYPAQFYAPFDPANYELCFTCHDEKMVTAAETTTATRFRDGSRNLHFLHVNNPTRGRTCRACHEVHAAKQQFQIRDGVPYGNKGWILKVNYTSNPNGGTCDKTCHTAKTYDTKANANIKK